MSLSLVNIVITAICLFGLGFYFNSREKKLHKMADLKFLEIRERYMVQIAQRKAKEKAEIERIKSILARLETKHKKMLSQKDVVDPTKYLKEAEEIVKKTEKRAKEIEKEAKEKADRYVSEQKAEIEGKMVDLVMGVTKKVISKSLNYSDHRELIEQALQEVEGD